MSDPSEQLTVYNNQLWLIFVMYSNRVSDALSIIIIGCYIFRTGISFSVDCSVHSVVENHLKRSVFAEMVLLWRSSRCRLDDNTKRVSHFYTQQTGMCTSHAFYYCLMRVVRGGEWLRQRVYYVTVQIFSVSKVYNYTLYKPHLAHLSLTKEGVSPLSWVPKTSI